MALTPEQIKTIEDMYKKGESIAKIAKTIGTSRQTVHAHLQKRYPEQFKNDAQQLQNQAQTQPQEQQTPAVSQIQKELVENAPEKEGDMLAKILSKYNLSQPLTAEEVGFLIDTLKKKYLTLDKVLQEELKQGAENEARKAFLAKLNGIIEDALGLGIEMHYIANQYKEFCERRGMSFVDAVKVAMELYATNQIQHEETPSETIMKVLDKIVQVNATRQLNTILLARILMGE